MASGTDWKKANPERAKAYQQAYEEAHREERRLYQQRYRAENSEKKRASSRASWAKHRERRTQGLRARWAKLRGEILRRYGGDPPCCACCGESAPGFLALDHPDNDGAVHRKTVGYGRVYWELRKLGFPDGYRVLCHNCNCAIGFYGACPHDNSAAGDPFLEQVGEGHGRRRPPRHAAGPDDLGDRPLLA
jgi:hypothetical protein